MKFLFSIQEGNGRPVPSAVQCRVLIVLKDFEIVAS